MTISNRQTMSRLRQFARPADRGDVCELCGVALDEPHEHLLESATQHLLCCCHPCGLLIGDQQAGRFRRIPDRVEFLSDLRIADADWKTLNVPVELAFLYFSTSEGRMLACYPGPIGSIADPVEPAAWQSFAERHALAPLEPDTEALLFRRANATFEVYRVPVTECRSLIGIFRRHWEGLTGGAQVWQELERFFIRLKERSEGRFPSPATACGPPPAVRWLAGAGPAPGGAGERKDSPDA